MGKVVTLTPCTRCGVYSSATLCIPCENKARLAMKELQKIINHIQERETVKCLYANIS